MRVMHTRCVRRYACMHHTDSQTLSIFLVQNKYTVDNAGTNHLAIHLAKAHGWLSVECEYRRRDDEGGGWPGTNQDVLAAFISLDTLFTKAQLRSSDRKILVFGHSAGGCLGLWLQHAIASESAPEISLVAAIAPVADLEAGFAERLSDEGDAIPLYMKCAPDESDEARAKYHAASPKCLLPVQRPTLIVIGLADVDVPPTHVISFAEAAINAGGEEVSLLKLEDADHFDVVTGSSNVWPTIYSAITERLGM